MGVVCAKGVRDGVASDIPVEHVSRQTERNKARVERVRFVARSVGVSNHMLLRVAAAFAEFLRQSRTSRTRRAAFKRKLRH